MKHQGCHGLAPVLRAGVAREEPGQIEVQDLEYAHPGTRSRNRRERLDVRVVHVYGKDDELVEAAVAPRGEQIVQEGMETLLTHTRGSRVDVQGADIDPIGNRGSAQDLKVVGETDGEGFGDPGGGANRQVRPILVASTDGHDQATIAHEVLADLGPAEVRQQEGFRLESHG